MVPPTEIGGYEGGWDTTTGVLSIEAPEQAGIICVHLTNTGDFYGVGEARRGEVGPYIVVKVVN